MAHCVTRRAAVTSQGFPSTRMTVPCSKQAHFLLLLQNCNYHHGLVAPVATPLPMIDRFAESEHDAQFREII